MRKWIVLAVAATAISAAVPAAAYILSKPSNDELGDTLRAYGFMPIKPPSNLMHVGSLYYVDAAAHSFTPICDATKTDINGSATTSPSWDMRENLERRGQFATHVKVNLASVFDGGGDADESYVEKVHSSLTDIVLEEIPLGASWLIFGKLMTRPECNKVAMHYVYSSGFVCQGQRILQATAEFKLNLDTNGKLATHAKADKVKSAVKNAIEAHGEQSVVERNGRLFAGKALQYGVAMNPICLFPPNARFERILPRTVWDRVVNFVLFNIVEPVLPAKHDDTEVAQASRTASAQ